MDLQQLDGHMDELGALADGNVNMPSAKDSVSSIETLTRDCLADQLAGITSRLFAPERGIPGLLKRSIKDGNDSRNSKELRELREQARPAQPSRTPAASRTPRRLSRVARAALPLPGSAHRGAHREAQPAGADCRCAHTRARSAPPARSSRTATLPRAEYAVQIIEVCVFVFQREKHNQVREYSFHPLTLALALKEHVPDKPALDLLLFPAADAGGSRRGRNIVSVYWNAMCGDAMGKPSPGVLGSCMRLLGKLARHFPVEARRCCHPPATMIASSKRRCRDDIFWRARAGEQRARLPQRQPGAALPQVRGDAARRDVRGGQPQDARAGRRSRGARAARSYDLVLLGVLIIVRGCRRWAGC